MNYQTSQSKGDRFMKGWQTLFSKSQQTGKKPFPKDRFFSPEELEFLDTTQSELSLLEKWALQLGKWARDKSETSHFPQVKWQAGRFSTWVDNIEEIDSKNKQIERFRQLKADGYVLPSAYESMIEDKLGKDLVGMFFKQGHGNKERICTVDAYIGGNSARESHIAYSTFLSPSTQPELHEIPLARFQQLIQSKELVQLTPEETKSWVKGREQVEAARKDFMALQKDIGKTYPLNFGGDFPAVSRKQIFSQFLQKNITPLSWSLNAKDDMKVNFYVNDRWEKVQQLDITPLNVHQHMELLRTVKTQLESDNLNAEAMLCRLGAQSAGNKYVSAEDGLSEVRQLIRKLGYVPDHYKLADGCGVSNYNYISSELLVAFLKFAYSRTDVFQKLYKALPIGGVDGTLKNRMKKGTPSYKKVHAKTGSFTAINCLAGY